MVDAFFWVGAGSDPTKNGFEGTKVADENGKTEPLRRYDAKTLVLTLPGQLTVFDIDWFSVWCRAFAIDFSHIRIPHALNVPPSLKMLGVAPQVSIYTLFWKLIKRFQKSRVDIDVVSLKSIKIE